MAKLYFKYGAMDSSKSANLLQTAYNYTQKGMQVCLAKPIIDTKGENKIVSRIGLERTVDFLIETNENIINKFNGYDVILIDEAQFLTEQQINQLYYITKTYEIPVICYGLRCDFLMNSFEGSRRLLEIADTIEEIKTICSCGKKATQNLRIINGKPVFSGAQTMIDNSAEVRYESKCGKCYLKLKEQFS